MFSMRKRRLRGDLSNAYQFLKHKCHQDDTFSGVQRQDKGQYTQTGTQKAPCKQKEKILHFKVAEHWTRQQGEVLDSPSLESF